MEISGSDNHTNVYWHSMNFSCDLSKIQIQMGSQNKGEVVNLFIFTLTFGLHPDDLGLSNLPLILSFSELTLRRSH